MNAKANPIPISCAEASRLMLRVPEAARLLGIATRTFQRLLAAGKIGPKPIKLGGTTLFHAGELETWAASAIDGVLPTRAEWAGRTDHLARPGAK